MRRLYAVLGLAPAALAAACPTTGGPVIEHLLTGTKITFTGITPNVTRRKEVGLEQPKMRITAYSSTPMVTSSGGTTNVQMADCAIDTSTVSASSLAMPKWWATAALLGVGSAHGGRLVGGAAVALSMLTVVQGQDANVPCDQVLEIEIVTPAEDGNGGGGGQGAGECAETDPVKTTATKMSIFDPPTGDEMVKVHTRMQSYDFTDDLGFAVTLNNQPLSGPNRTAIGDLFGADSLATTQKASPGPIWGGIMTNYIARIDTYPPVKSEALAYLDGSGAKPIRYAKVNVNFGGIPEPKFMEYKVGPLDVNDDDLPAMTVTQVNGVQRWDSRPREGNEMRALKNMVDIMLNEDRMKTICQESFGATHGDGLNNHEPAPPGIAPYQRTTQILINYAIGGTWRGKDLHLVPLSFTINNTHQDPSMWVATNWYYNLQGPFTIDQLVTKYSDGSLTKVTMPSGHREAVQLSAFPQRRPDAPTRAHSDIPGPAQYMPSGPRFEVHGGAEGRTVKWMDWEFHAGYTFRAGPDFHNIKFKGQRIAYQVALNEVGLIYSADDPVAGNVFFLDSTFGNGEYRELMAGIDCPAHATYLTNYWWAAPGGKQTASRSVCVFETWSGNALWRRGGSFVSGMRDYELHVRFAMPNGNYDYVITYIFKLDGTMRVDCSSTGYMQTHYWPMSRASRDSMAFKVHAYTGGSMHDHTYGWKVDLDVGGEDNTFSTAEFKMADTLTALNADRAQLGMNPLVQAPPYLLWNKMRYYEMAKITNENAARVNIDPMKPKLWLFGDDTQKNAYGNVKQYKLSLDHTVSSVIDDDHYTMQNGAYSYAKNMLTVTKYKEDEQTLTGPYDLNRLDAPQGALANMVNGENIEQQDLVAWVTLVAMHLPSSEDYPMVNSIGHGFTLKPYNFFDENAVMDMPHYLRMHPGEAPGDDRAENEIDVPRCVPKNHSMAHGFAGV